jgi:hypothetical protein
MFEYGRRKLGAIFDIVNQMDGHRAKHAANAIGRPEKAGRIRRSYAKCDRVELRVLGVDYMSPANHPRGNAAAEATLTSFTWGCSSDSKNLGRSS